MNRTHFLAALLCLTVLTAAAEDASAYLHPRLGRFLSRDPGPGGAMRSGTSQPTTGGQGFLPRDPDGTGQYADGMNLYQYVRGNPVKRSDSSGLYGRETHEVRTREIASSLRIGFQDWAARRLGEADQSVDGLIGPTGWLLVGLDWHFDIDTAGGGRASVWNNRDSRYRRSQERLAEAVRLCTQVRGRHREAVWELGRGLHPLQDFYAHGNWRVWFFPSPIPLMHPGWYDDPTMDGRGPGGIPVATPDDVWSRGRRGDRRYLAMQRHTRRYLRAFIRQVSAVRSNNARQCLCNIFSPMHSAFYRLAEGWF